MMVPKGQRWDNFDRQIRIWFCLLFITTYFVLHVVFLCLYRDSPPITNFVDFSDFSFSFSNKGTINNNAKENNTNEGE